MKNQRHSYFHKAIGLALLLPAAGLLLPALGQGDGGSPAAASTDYDLSWYTIDGGGEMFSTGGDYELSGTIGQPDARTEPMTGGDYSVTGGFWVVTEPSCNPDFDGDGDVDAFDFLTFSNCFNGPLNPPRPACMTASADIDGDGDVDVADFQTFVACFNGSLNPPQAGCPCGGS